MNIVDAMHDRFVHTRRVRVLAKTIAEQLVPGGRVLDVGCGDGLLTSLLQRAHPESEFVGIEVLPRATSYHPVMAFDGRKLPFDDRSFDFVLFIDVLHHSDESKILLAEAARVARRAVIIKDHLLQGLLAGSTLAFMDHVGNARYGVPLPNHYWTEAQWRNVFCDLGLEIQAWQTDLALYPWWADWLFGRSLHFLARVSQAHATGSSSIP